MYNMQERSTDTKYAFQTFQCSFFRRKKALEAQQKLFAKLAAEQMKFLEKSLETGIVLSSFIIGSSVSNGMFIVPTGYSSCTFQ